MPEAQTHADTYHRHGEADSSKWEQADAVTGREADPVPTNTTFADRAKADTKAVQSAENKAVQGAESKSLDDMSKDELYAMATDQDIEGRSSMSKGELIKALGG